MQRKSYILNKKRNGMALIMAIAVVLIIATVMGLSLAMTTQTSKRTTDLYIYEQAVLLSKSAAEYSLLKIAQDGPCTHYNDLNWTQDSYYKISIRNKYIYTSPSPCSAAQTFTTVTTPEQNGSVLMDITVTVDDPTLTPEPVRYFRRTIQKL
jgi:type II secretory pathway pseudopilin PulG